MTTDQITKLGYIMQSGDTIVEKEYKEELAEDDDYDEKGPIDFDEQVAEENGTELSMEPEKDDWTLGSGDTVVETDKVGVSTEDIEEIWTEVEEEIEEGEGNIVYDQSGNFHDGTILTSNRSVRKERGNF